MSAWLASIGTKIGQWVVNKVILSILEWAGKYVPYMIQEWKRKKEREIAQAEAKKKYDETVANPESTIEERAKAYADFINTHGK